MSTSPAPSSPSPPTPDSEPQVRSLARLGRIYTALNATLLLTALACGAVLFFRPNRDEMFFACLGGLVAAVAGCFVLDRVLINHIACPQCGDKLPRTKAPKGKLITLQYHCPRCHIVWDTEPPPDSGPIRYSDPL